MQRAHGHTGQCHTGCVLTASRARCGAAGVAHHAWMSRGVRASRRRQQPPYSGVQHCWVLHGLLLRGRGLGQCPVQGFPQHSRLCGPREHLRQQSDIRNHLGAVRAAGVAAAAHVVACEVKLKHTHRSSALSNPLLLSATRRAPPPQPWCPLPYLPQGQNGASVCDNNPFKHSMDGAVTGRHSRHSSSLGVELLWGARGRALYTVQCSGVDKRQTSGL